MITRLPRVLLLTCAFFLPAASASAQSPLAEGTWALTPLIGIALDPDADVSLTLAGAAAFPIASNLAIEGEIGHLFDMAPDDPTVDSALTTVHGTLLAFFESGFVLTPYLAAGIGAGKFSHDVTAPPPPFRIDSTEIGINLGGGVMYQIDDPVWLRGDFRYFKHIDNVPSAWRFGFGVTLRIGS